jgi:anti-anti-sigma factor
MILSMPELVPFRVVESRDPDGTLRIALIRELDLAVASQLGLRLDQLVGEGTRVRIDLAQLEFIDSTGITALLLAVRNGCDDGVPLVEINSELPDAVQKVIDLRGVGPALWPANGSPR